jgi:hypothetical protein
MYSPVSALAETGELATAAKFPLNGTNTVPSLPN